MKYLIEYGNFESIGLNENTNSENIKSAIETGLDQLKETILQVCLTRTEPQYKNLVKIAYNRVVGKLLPLLKSYLIPTIKKDNQILLREKVTKAEQFFNDVWPKFWDSFSSLEKGIIKKFTSLSRETTYREMMDGAQSSMTQFGFDGIDQEVLKIIFDQYRKSISEIGESSDVEISNSLLDEISKDLGTPSGWNSTENVKLTNRN